MPSSANLSACAGLSARQVDREPGVYGRRDKAPISDSDMVFAEHRLVGKGDDVLADVGDDELFEELCVDFRAISGQVAGLGIASETAGAECPGTLEYLPFLNTYLLRFGGHCWPHQSTENPL